MSDTYTTLNPGTGGDKMDESAVTQLDGTAAKRPRVVMGTDAGYLQSYHDRPDGHEARIADDESRMLLSSLLETQRETNALLRILLLQLSGDVPTASMLEEMKSGGV